AMIIMAKNPAAHGLEGIPVDPPIEYDTIEMTAPTSLALLADLIARPLAELRELNPALLKDLAPEGYSLRVPKGTAPQLAALLEGIPSERRQGVRAHRVVEGETLASIARRYRVAERSLAAVNGDLVDGLEPGDIVLVPAGTGLSPGKATVKSPGPARRAGAERATAQKRGAARTVTARNQSHSLRRPAAHP
ncbi:MAG: LysM peptidoglycan-binding domain-containing protein, partial [Bryobacterales bacterium]|nr:LysM peptidoglycan-binding domain-containing protein [Bryobacteraceae bacterium]MDW8129690.1 LysM peptidoglycan-binding domain-containing protein [Bryobacterales bacterium]